MGDHIEIERDREWRGWRYVPPWVLGGVVVGLGAIGHALWGGKPVETPLVALAEAGVTGALAVFVYAVSRRAGREALIRWHTTVSVILAGLAVTLTTVLGWSWTWAEILVGGIALFAFSWNLRRFEALRAQKQNKNNGAEEFKKAIGIGKTKLGIPRQEGARIEIPVKPGPGETVRDIQNALPKVEAATGMLAHRGRVVPGEMADDALMVLITEDLLKNAIPWPGPSSPGGSIADPIVTGIYEDDIVSQYWFPGDMQTGRAPLMFGVMGMTRSGKTVFGLVSAVEILTRCDVVLWWADATKGAQTASAIRSGLDWYADSTAAAKQMFKATKEVVRARADALGNAGYAQWTPEAFTDSDLRMPYLIVWIEEADELIADSELYKWLTSKALSAGVSIVASLQRMSHTNMPTDARANLTGGACFGVRDTTDAGFALSEDTMDAGAHPEKWKTSKQGYYYLEAPGIEQDRWPIPQRAYLPMGKESKNPADLLAPIVAQFAGIRAELDQISVGAADRATGGRYSKRAKADASAAKNGGQVVTTDDAEEIEEVEGVIVPDDAEEAEMIEEAREAIPPQPDPEMADGQDPMQAIPEPNGPDVQFGGVKPEAVSQEVAENTFDELVRTMAIREGRDSLTVNDVVQRYPYRSRPWMSKRLSAVANGEVVIDPGLVLERTDVPGRYDVKLLATASIGDDGE